MTLGVQPGQLLGELATSQQQAPLVPLCCPPVRTQETLCSHAQQLQQQLQQLLPHSQMFLQDICTAAGIQPASSMQHPLFQAGVAVASSTAAAAEAAAGLDLTLVLVPAASSQAAESQVYLLYNSGLFTQEGAQLMAQHFQVCTPHEQCLAHSPRLPCLYMPSARCLLVLRVNTGPYHYA